MVNTSEEQVHSKEDLKKARVSKYSAVVAEGKGVEEITYYYWNEVIAIVTVSKNGKKKR